MEVWRPQRNNCFSAKVYCSVFHVKAMNRHANGAGGIEELGDREQWRGLAGTVAVFARRTSQNFSSPP